MEKKKESEKNQNAAKLSALFQINPDNIVIISSSSNWSFLLKELKKNKNFYTNSQRDTSSKAEAREATLAYLT